MRKTAYALLLLAMLASCVSRKKLAYFQSNKFSETTPTLVENQKTSYKMQPNDVVSVKVVSLDQASTNVFDNQAGNIGGNSPAAGFFFSGYSVDEKGFIDYPTVGKVKLSGLTVEEARNAVQTQVSKYLSNATVVLKLVSFKVTVLGEVRNPGYYYVYNNQATLPEVLGLSSDLTANANRKNVKLIRQTQQGSEVVLLDLTNPNVIKSPYFYMQPNDVLYVEPLRAQLTRSNLTPLGTAFGAISVIVLIANFVYNVNN